MEVVPRTGMVSTREQVITSGHLHIEWATPRRSKATVRGGETAACSSEGFPELQVLDPYHNKTSADGQAGAF